MMCGTPVFWVECLTSEMKLAILAESPADEEAARIIIQAITGSVVDWIPGPRLRYRGWPAVRQQLRTVFLHLFYQTDATGLIVVIDSNASELHEIAHEEPDGVSADCRICQLRAAIVTQPLRPRPAPLTPLSVAFGVAVPAIEAWYLCSVDPHVTEAAWINGLASGVRPYTKQRLKEQVYGAKWQTRPLEMDRAKAAARRLAENNLDCLEDRFPSGFGSLSREVRSWAARGRA